GGAVGGAGVEAAGAAALFAGGPTRAPGSTPFCVGAPGALAVGAAIAAAPPFGGVTGAAAVGAGVLGVGDATLGVGVPTLGGVTTGADAAGAGFPPCKLASADSTASPAPTPSAGIAGWGWT